MNCVDRVTYLYTLLDSILQSDTYNDCFDNVSATIHLLQSLGFIIHPDKSVLIPTQKIEYLGFILDSVNLTIEVTTRKKQKIHDLIEKILALPIPPISLVACLLGNLVATSEGIPLAILRYRIVK